MRKQPDQIQCQQAVSLPSNLSLQTHTEMGILSGLQVALNTCNIVQTPSSVLNKTRIAAFSPIGECKTSTKLPIHRRKSADETGFCVGRTDSGKPKEIKRRRTKASVVGQISLALMTTMPNVRECTFGQYPVPSPDAILTIQSTLDILIIEQSSSTNPP